MTIYSKKEKGYRKLWVKYHGKPIPVDEFGRSYDIHHIDGDKTNNSKENLLACPIQEHYDIHFRQEDSGACAAIALRMKLSPELIGELSKKAQQKLVDEGKHHWLKENGGGYRPDPEVVKQFQLERLELGVHVFQQDGFEEKRLSGYFSSLEERKSNGVFHMITNNPGKKFPSNINQKLLAEGKHSSQKPKKYCQYCNKYFSVGPYGAHHGEKCKMKGNINVV